MFHYKMFLIKVQRDNCHLHNPCINHKQVIKKWLGNKKMTTNNNDYKNNNNKKRNSRKT